MKYNRYQKRDAIRDYFPLPNEIFCLNLSYGEIAVYAYLLYREDRKTFKCHPSYRTIGDALKMSRNTVGKYVNPKYGRQICKTAGRKAIDTNRAYRDQNRKRSEAQRQSALYDSAC